MRGRWLGWATLAALCALAIPLALHRSVEGVVLGRFSVAYAALLGLLLFSIAAVVFLLASDERRYRAVFNKNLLALAIGVAVALGAAELVARRILRDRFQHYPKSIVTRTRTAEYDVEIATNAEGFRDITPVLSRPQARSSGACRVALLGDSFIWGSGVEYVRTLGVALEAETMAFKSGLGRVAGGPGGWTVFVSNFGVAGTGPLHHRAVYRGAVRKARGDASQIVIVTFYAGNDLTDAAREQRERNPRCALRVLVGEAAARFGEVAGASRGAGPPAGVTARPADTTIVGWNAFGGENPADLESLLWEGRRRGVPADTIRARLGAIPESIVAAARAFRSNPYNLAGAVLDPESIRKNVLLEGPDMEDAWGIAERALDALSRDIERDKARLILVAIPAGAQVDSAYWGAARLGYRFNERMLREAPVQERLARFASARRIPFVDLLPAFRAWRGEPLYFADDGHWNMAGHRLAAATIAPHLEALLREISPSILPHIDTLLQEQESRPSKRR